MCVLGGGAMILDAALCKGLEDICFVFRLGGVERHVLPFLHGKSVSPSHRRALLPMFRGCVRVRMS